MCDIYVSNRSLILCVLLSEMAEAEGGAGEAAELEASASGGVVPEPASEVSKQKENHSSIICVIS